VSALQSAATGARTARPRAGAPADDPRVGMLTTQFKKARYRADALIDVLHAAQDIYGSLSPDLLWTVADALELPPSRVMGVATFYHLFTFEPRGEHTCTVCTGTACFVKGADALMAAVSEGRGVAKGETRGDGQLSLLEARCVGSCGLAPVALVDGAVVAKATPATLLAAIDAVGVPVAAMAAPVGNGAPEGVPQDGPAPSAAGGAA
jgi:bidirectional [NiFe] hydrogenase diaphorase subunit